MRMNQYFLKRSDKMRTNTYEITEKNSIRVKTRFGITDYADVDLTKVNLDKSIENIIKQLEQQ